MEGVVIVFVFLDFRFEKDSYFLSSLVILRLFFGEVFVVVEGYGEVFRRKLVVYYVEELWNISFSWVLGGCCFGGCVKMKIGERF